MTQSCHSPVFVEEWTRVFAGGMIDHLMTMMYMAGRKASSILLHSIAGGEVFNGKRKDSY